ncbi:NADH-quinone oxidoreductase subunit J family protein [Desulfogranum japonicum]|uniref:NADH-quinone oxidoreductase subunit J family protein n=1 Tax=Desulfogranum japonicum TaxID=231447 RepID=UPI0003F520B5|nr:NADH-quinone oxidoreductase subunit J [Desulfogranum japonicum]
MQPLVCPSGTLPSLFSAEGFAGIIFLLTVFLVISGAVIAVVSKRLVRAVAGLAVCFTGLAGVYYFLLSPFVAMMQMLIYVGAVSILIAFGIMMATPEDKITPDNKYLSKLIGPLAGSVGALFFAGFSLLAVKTDWQVFPEHAAADGSIKAVGMTLLTTHSMVFELISIVLLLAIIGALVLARRGRN